MQPSAPRTQPVLGGCILQRVTGVHAENVDEEEVGIRICELEAPVRYANSERPHRAQL